MIRKGTWMAWGSATALALALLRCGPPAGNAGSPATRQATPAALASTYSSIYQNIIAPKCLSCHNSSVMNGNTDLSSYHSLTQSTTHADLVDPGKPDLSRFYVAVKSGQMPQNASPLSPGEIQAIRDWITAGAKDN